MFYCHVLTNHSLQESCLLSTNGLFDGCATNDLACLCRLDQPEVARYVTAVQPCIDGDAGHIACTDGGIQGESLTRLYMKMEHANMVPEYKDVLRNVCNTEQFGYKQAVFPPPEETS
jgi:hypothetical protein